VREYLQAHDVEFDDRNIRHSEEARRELQALNRDLLVPLLVYGDQQVVGFDPDQLDQVVTAYFSVEQRS
jgi:glutaredoxin